MSRGDLLGLIGAIIGLIGVVGAIIGVVATIRASTKQEEAAAKQRKAEAEARRVLGEVHQLQQAASQHREEIDHMRSLQRRLDWSDVDREAMRTAQWLVERDRHVDIILAPGARGAIYGQRIAEYLPGDPPMIVGITRPNGLIGKRIFEDDGVLVTNDDWAVEFPHSIRTLSTLSVLVVDDYARGGSFMTELRRQLAAMNYSDITTVVLVAMRHGHAKVDYAAIPYNEDDFRFPWGIAA